ncbi:bifunctional DNA primase/polymerase [Kocuria rosea]|uniref:bifunctional DNA primase/polymerase n=1 Tax=Kocuria rosea TaxID=1275 RepID=UPI00253F8A0D|nr:bifunctional DNA primase/polymerase [Kocuria rosea]WIG18393.1 bifunctional DNA primase/polymerase [Kocuria rosea]
MSSPDEVEAAPGEGTTSLSTEHPERLDINISVSADSEFLYRAARSYALDYGWSVFPLKPREKRPATANGLHDATIDLTVIERWWRANPNFNIGIRTGAGGPFVIDIDSQQGADNLNAARGNEEGTFGPLVLTHKGYHLYFADDALPSRTALVEGVDCRGVGGYVVAPPSVHPNGTVYTWDEDAGPDTPLERVPQWLRPLVVEQAPAPRLATPPVHLSSARGTAYARKAFESEIGRLATAAEGTRNHTLNACAFNLGQLVGAGALDAAEVASTLLRVAVQVGLGEREAERTIASGLSSGMQEPRKGLRL